MKPLDGRFRRAIHGVDSVGRFRRALKSATEVPACEALCAERPADAGTIALKAPFPPKPKTF